VPLVFAHLRQSVRPRRGAEGRRSSGPAASDRLAPSRCARGPAARQRPRPDAEIRQGSFILTPLDSHHSITSSARASSFGGTVRPSGAQFQPLSRFSPGFGGGGGSERRMVALASAASRLLRAYSGQVETLRRLRHGSDQYALMYKCKVRAQQPGNGKAGDDERKGHAAELTNC
jgi:hypothetical protein